MHNGSKVSVRDTFVKELQVSNEQKKTHRSKSAVLTMSAKVKESDIELLE